MVDGKGLQFQHGSVTGTTPALEGAGLHEPHPALGALDPLAVARRSLSRL